MPREEPLISVVVPVYNAAPFLRRTVSTICAQTCRDLEILLINDGSGDDSWALCQELAEEDPRIRCYTQSNGGAAAARNHGIRKARGRYIGFVDSDDLIHPEMYEHLLAGARQLEAKGLHSFIVQTGRQEINEAGEPLADAVIPPDRETLVSPMQFAESLLLYTGDASFCTALLPAAYMKQHPFPEGVMGEDFRLLMEMANEAADGTQTGSIQTTDSTYIANGGSPRGIGDRQASSSENASGKNRDPKPETFLHTSKEGKDTDNLAADGSLQGVLRLPYRDYQVVHRRGSATRRAAPSQFSRVYIDIVDHADYVEQKMVPRHPELAVPALRFGLYERLDYLLHVPIPDMNSTNLFYQSVLLYLRKNYRAMRQNPYLTRRNKLYLTLLTIAPKKTRQLHWALRKKAILRDAVGEMQ